MDISAVGLKASIQVGQVRADVSAGASLTAITSDSIMTVFSGETGLDMELEVLQWDNATWGAVEDIAGTVWSANNDDPTMPAVPIPMNSSHVRVRNSNAGARWIKVLVWELV